MSFIDIFREFVLAIRGLLDWYKALLAEHFLEIYLATIFFVGAVVLHLWGDNSAVSDWVQKGAVIGAILMLIKDKRPPSAPAEPPKE